MLRTKVNIEVERTLHCFPNARLLPYPFGKNQCADCISIKTCIVESRTDIVIGFQPPLELKLSRRVYSRYSPSSRKYAPLSGSIADL